MFDFDDLEEEIEQQEEEIAVSAPMRQKDVQVEGLRATVSCCPLDSRRVPVAVLICPGHHGKQFGSSHKDAPLLKAIAEKLEDENMPHVRFNYGAMDKPNFEGHGVEEAAVADVEAMVNYMLAELCDRVHLVGYSLGSNASLDILLAQPERVPKYVAMSVGSEYWKFCQGPDRPKGFAEKVRKNFERHAELTQEAVYICGTKDSLLNMMKLKYVLSQRKDAGQGVTTESLEGGQHDLGGHEERVAKLVADFVVENTQDNSARSTESTDAPKPDWSRSSSGASKPPGVDRLSNVA